MEISIHSLLEGATRATGTVAVIDVFRAFTTAAVALSNGASSIVMVRTIEEGLALREAGIGEVCMGEVGGRTPGGFDFGNSPFEISTVHFHGKTIIQRTSAGTQGVVATSKAKRLYAASLVTAEATEPRPFLGFTRCLPRRDGRQRAEANRRRRTAQSIFGTAWKADRVMQSPFVASFGRVAKSGAFMIRPDRICTRRTSTSRSTSIATISP